MKNKSLPTADVIQKRHRLVDVPCIDESVEGGADHQSFASVLQIFDVLDPSRVATDQSQRSGQFAQIPQTHRMVVRTTGQQTIVQKPASQLGLR